MITTIADYDRPPVVDPRCDCGGEGDQYHAENIRCGLCAVCGTRIKGIWLNEHEGQCWAKERV